jgi:hypothetical protein
MKIYQGQPSTSDALLYIADRRFDSFAICVTNTTASAATLTINMAYQAAAAAASNQIISAASIPANSVAVFEFPIELVVGDSIRGLQGTSTALTVTIDGAQR